MTTLAWTRKRAGELLGRHLPRWTFEFDHARARVGACHYDTRRITLSRHLVLHLTPADVDQALFHEIAHGLVGKAAGHGPAWRKAAARLGYTGGRTIPVPAARAQARWSARCPEGHEYHRHRRPSRQVFCGPCSKKGVWHPLQWADTSS